MTPDPITASCRKSHYPAYRNSGTRPLSAIKIVVLHDTEGGDAYQIAGFFRGFSAEGSAHIVVDDRECQRCLPDSAIPWAAPNANAQGWHVEQCGYAAWSGVVWRRHLRTLKRAAYKTAFHCHKFGIPPRFVKAKGLAKGKSGVTTHRQVSLWSAAAGLPGDHSHTDPGPLWPRHLFMLLVRRYYRQLQREKGR